MRIPQPGPRSHIPSPNARGREENSTILFDNPKSGLCCGVVGPGQEVGPTRTSIEEPRFLDSWLKPLKKLDLRKRKIWI
jgi:hypothetical protein